MKLEIRTRRSFGDVKVSTRGVQVSLQVTSNLTDSYEETEQMRKVVEVIQGALKEAGITPYFMPEKAKCATPPPSYSKRTYARFCGSQGKVCKRRAAGQDMESQA